MVSPAERYTRFQDIPQFTRDGNYAVNVSWRFLENTLRDWAEGQGMDMDPDYQREHVWTEEQQVAYCEFILRGGKSGRDIRWNCPSWQHRGAKGPIELVDGKQRLTAVRRFLTDGIRVFGSLCSEFGDQPDFIRHSFVFIVNDLQTRAEVLDWYLGLNAGGTPHTPEEIARVRAMLREELKKEERA